MKEIEIVGHTTMGTEPFELHSITFRDINTKKKYVISGITNADYLFFKRSYEPETATGWKGYKFLEKKYGFEPENTPEDDEAIRKGFEEFWKTHPKPDDKK